MNCKQGNNQSDNGGNDLNVSSSRAGSTADHGNLSQSGQSDTLHGDSQQQSEPRERQSNAAAADGDPRNAGGNRQSADEKMDDDTGLSNTANREPSERDHNLRQERQSNVGRRSDGTPD